VRHDEGRYDRNAIPHGNLGDGRLRHSGMLGQFLFDLAGGDLAASLSSFAATTLAAYKRPKEYIFVEALPKAPNVKIKRSDLKKAATGLSS